MKRRKFVRLLGGTSLAWPLAVRAQEAGRTYRLGFLIPSERESPQVIACFDELRRFGFIEGRNLVILPGGFAVRSDQVAEVAAALAKAAPDAIISGPDVYTRTLQAVTRTIPLICMTEDMVGRGTGRLSRSPRRQHHGDHLLSPELAGKRQDILIELLPGVRRIAALANSAVTPQRHLQDLQDAARRSAVELVVFPVTNREEIVPALDRAKAAAPRRSTPWPRRYSLPMPE